MPMAEESSDPIRSVESSPQSASREVLAGLLVGAFALVVFFFYLGTYGLWEPDEARYAEIAREILVLHDWIVPHLNFVPYIEKPPLLYWLTALSMQLFGVNEFAARFVNAAAALIGVLTTYFFALRVYGLRHAIVAASVLTTSALYAVMAQVLTTDMLLTSMVTIALFAFFLHWREGGRWCWIAYIAMGLGVLTKGPIAVALPTTSVALFVFFRSEMRTALRGFHVIAGYTLAALVCAPWFIAIAIRQPDFIHFYFIGEHLQRFFDKSYSHGEPFYYYVPVVLGGLLPWTLLAILLPWRSMPPDPARRYCLIAFATILVVFSAANAKLVPYILPAMPPIAIVLADRLLALADNSRRLAAAGLMMSLTGGVVVGVASMVHRFASANPAMVQPELYAAGTIMLAAGAALFLFFSRNRLDAGLTTVAVSTAIILIVAGHGRIRMESLRSYAQLGRDIASLAPDSRLICYPRYIQSLPFYTQRRVILIGPKTELDYGATHAPDAAAFFYDRRTDLLRLWNSDPAPLLILDRQALPPLEQSLGSYRIVASDKKKLAITRSQGNLSKGDSR